MKFNRDFKEGDALVIVNTERVHWYRSYHWLFEVIPGASVGMSVTCRKGIRNGIMINESGLWVDYKHFLLKSDYDKIKKDYDDQLTTGMFFEWHPELTGNWEKDIDKWIELAEKEDEPKDGGNDRVEEMVKDVKEKDLKESSFEEHPKDTQGPGAGNDLDKDSLMDELSKWKRPGHPTN